MQRFYCRDQERKVRPSPADPERGKTTLLESRCVSCHTIEGKGGKTGPELSRVSSKAYPERLFKVIEDPHALWSESKMPIFGFADQDIRNMVTFMAMEYTDLDLDEEAVAGQVSLVNSASKERGQELVVKQGCIGCHSKIKGVKELGELGPDLTTFGVVHISFLEFGDIKVPLKDRTVPNWIYNKMKSPRLFKEGLKMPDYYFNEEQATAITTYTAESERKRGPCMLILFPLASGPRIMPRREHSVKYWTNTGAWFAIKSTGREVRLQMTFPRRAAGFGKPGF